MTLKGYGVIITLFCYDQNSDFLMLNEEEIALTVCIVGIKVLFRVCPS
jgi:hypothetical protein